MPPNSEIALTVGLVAPKPCRDFVSKWRMCTPDGRQFGDYLWALINVDLNATAREPVVTRVDTKASAKAPAASAANTKPVAAVTTVAAPANTKPAAAAAAPANTKPAAAGTN